MRERVIADGRRAGQLSIGGCGAVLLGELAGLVVGRGLGPDVGDGLLRVGQGQHPAVGMESIFTPSTSSTSRPAISISAAHHHALLLPRRRHRLVDEVHLGQAVDDLAERAVVRPSRSSIFSSAAAPSNAGRKPGQDVAARAVGGEADAGSVAAAISAGGGELGRHDLDAVCGGDRRGAARVTLTGSAMVSPRRWSHTSSTNASSASVWSSTRPWSSTRRSRSPSASMIAPRWAPDARTRPATRTSACLDVERDARRGRHVRVDGEHVGAELAEQRRHDGATPRRRSSRRPA